MDYALELTFQVCFISSDYLTVATTRPETLFGDVAIAVNPQVSWHSTIYSLTWVGDGEWILITSSISLSF